MAAIDKLLNGYKAFFDEYFTRENPLYRELAEKGQSPKTLFIACSDSRVDPSIITKAEPGDIFVIRNVANLIPPYQPVDTSYHGTSAALEFAVLGLGVENIVVLGHSECAGVRALVDNTALKDGYSFVGSWMGIAEDAKRNVTHLQGPDKYRACEAEVLKTSLRNLMTFPWVEERVNAGKLSLHAWHLNINTGALTAHTLDGKATLVA